MRGRIPNPATQKAKGNPGKRATKAERILAKGNACAALIPSAAKNVLMAKPPALLAGFPAGSRFWAEYAPLLIGIKALQAPDLPRFAMLCVAYGQWVEAVCYLRDDGCVHSVKTVAGGMMKRLSPYVAVEKLRFDQCQALFEQFGIGALDRAKLMRDRAALPPGSWSAGEIPDTPASRGGLRPSVIGGMDLLDGVAPEHIN